MSATEPTAERRGPDWGIGCALGVVVLAGLLAWFVIARLSGGGRPAAPEDAPAPEAGDPGRDPGAPARPKRVTAEEIRLEQELAKTRRRLMRLRMEASRDAAGAGWAEAIRAEEARAAEIRARLDELRGERRDR